MSLQMELYKGLKINKLGNNNFNDVINMENFWGRRFAALLVDIIILTLFMWIVSSVLFHAIGGIGILVYTKLLDFCRSNHYNSLLHIYGG